MLSPIPESTARPLLEQAKALQASLFMGIIGLPAGHAWSDNSAIAAWVKGLAHWCDIPDTAHSRFARSNSVWSRQVAIIAKASSAAKSEMRSVWDNHQRASELYVAGSSATMDMPDWDSSPEWRNLCDLMSSFYDETLGSGDFPLPGNLTMSRGKYQTGFSEVIVCPYWGCGLTAGEIELDHFFPQSTFPFLSVDPDNLVPVSHAPNRVGHKGFKIALDDRPTTQRRSAREWFHPRWRSAKGHVNAEVTRQAGAALRVRILPFDQQYKHHVDHLDWLLDLSSYWSEEANRPLRSDYKAVVDDAVFFSSTIERVIERRAAQFADPTVLQAHALLNQRKFEYFRLNPAELAEMAKQAAESQLPLRHA